MPPAPEGVSEDVHRRCHWAGEAAGSRAVEEMSEGAETFSALTGGLGAILALSAGQAKKEAAYKEAYQDCLEKAQD